MRYEVEISDTITYERKKTLIIDADDEDAAMEAARECASNGQHPDGKWIEFEEEEIDNTPWETKLIEREQVAVQGATA